MTQNKKYLYLLTDYTSAAKNFLMTKILSISFALIFSSFYSFSKVYEVGPGKAYLNISDVPLETLTAGDTVRIFYRDTPYKEKFVLGAAGTEAKPVVILGVPNNTGSLPIIDGDGAKTRTQLDFWNEVREIIKVGGSSVPSDNDRKFGNKKWSSRNFFHRP